MDLESKAGIVLLMMIGVGVLTVLARRRNFDSFRRIHTTRRQRVIVSSRHDPKRDEGTGG